MLDGFRRFEFHWAHQRHTDGTALTFRSHGDACFWLNRFRSRTAFMTELRSLLEYGQPRQSYQFADAEVVALIGQWLYSGRLRVTADAIDELRGSGGVRKDHGPIAFPLTDRIMVRQPSRKRTETEGPVFSLQADLVLQAAALVAAAREGRPFCPE